MLPEMQFKKTYILPAVAILLVGAILGVQLESALSDRDTFSQLRKLEKAFVIINRQYVEPVKSEKVAEHGITGMLKELDPHSSYISAKEVKEVQQSYRGSFGGIGIWFEMMNDTAQVVSPITDGPSEKMGVMPGDRIVAIEDSNAAGPGTSSEDIQRRLKGPIGTDVQMTVKRPGMKDRITFNITRDEIPLYSIDASYMIDDRTGYLKVNRFAMTTHEEFRDSLRVLKDQGLERLVLDLRNNPGGIMRSAIRMADELLAGGHTIVKTKGRDQDMNRDFGAQGGGSFEHQPVIVLVNGNSASASEIVSGALQDEDRALIVGQRTFGKGLIQKQFELPDGSMLQMTVGRYYTPAGRLIQTPYNGGDLEDYYSKKFSDYDRATYNPSKYKDSIPDSLKHTTDRGRTVFGGGGILPDYVVKPDTSGIIRAVVGNGVDRFFVRDWFADDEQRLRDTWAQRRQAFIDSYTVDDQMVDAFWSFAEEQGLTLTSDPAEVSRKDGVFLRAEAMQEQERLKTYLKARLAGRLYGGRASVPILNQVDTDLKEALTLWDRAEELAGFHAPGTADTRSGDR
jgi:carboxyl-terminal processing protease